jgi:hypothetical protein
MSAALVDLVSVGAQDAYITGEPQVSFWRQNYKRHTNFAIKPERMDYIGTFNGGNEVVVPIRSKGDLLSYIWIENVGINTPGVNTKGLLSTSDTSLTEFSLHIGGQEVCRMDSLYIQGVHNVLLRDSQAKTTCTVTTSEIADNAKGVSGSAADYYMIPFFFSEDWTKSLPLVALQYHDIELRIKCRSGLQNLAAVPKIYGMYAYLDTAEREHFTSQEHELLISQVQYQPMTKSDTSIDLTYFNHPVQSLHMTTSNVSGSGWTNDYSFDKSSLYINGLALFENMSNTFHHNVVHEMHTTTLAPSSLDALPLFSWPFCLTMNRSQPSGSLNFSRIDNAKLTIQSPKSDAREGLYRVYAVNYNILRIKDGMAGIAFSN